MDLSPLKIFAANKSANAIMTFAVALLVSFLASGKAYAQIEPQNDYFLAEGSVDLRTGNLMISSTDLVVGPAGAPHISLTRQHGIDVQDAFFGSGSTHNHNIYVRTVQTTDPLLAYPDVSYEYTVTVGQEVIKFKQSFPSQSAEYLGGKGGTHKLILAGRGNPEKYIGPDGTEIDFGSAAVNQCPSGSPPNCPPISNVKGALSVTSPTGQRADYHRVGVASYNVIPRIAYISTNTGFGIGFEYNSHGRITKSCAINLVNQAVSSSQPCANSTIATTYTYDGSTLSARLQTVTNAVGSSLTYAFDSYKIISLTLNQETTPVVTFQYNQSSGKLTGQTYADGTYREYLYQTHDDPWFQVQTNEWTEVTSPDGSVRRYEFGGGSWGSKPTAAVDELGRRTVFTYTWAPVATAVMASKTVPGGQRTEYTYGVRANVTETRQIAAPGSTLQDIVTKADFLPSSSGATGSCDNPVVCEKPLWTEDAKGSRTDFAYDPIHGGILKKTLPADDNGVRPETRYSYTQRYAWVKNGSGYAQVGTPVWLLVSEEYCISSAADVNGNCAAGAADEVVTSYEYQQGSSTQGSNLLLLGTAVTADGQTLRTCTSYDEWGRPISTAEPKAGLSSCS